MAPCPWSVLAPAATRFCEDPIPCAVIAEPANTWSNLGFLLVALAIRARRGRVERLPRVVDRFAPVALFLAFGSGAFHATRTWAGGMLDSTAMQAAAALMIVANLRRLFRTTERRERDDRRDDVLLLALGAAGALVVVLAPAFERTFFGLAMAFAGVLEIAVVVTRARVGPAHRWLALSWATFAPAFAFWQLDRRGVACDPANHVFSGHAAWHVLLAMSFFFLHRFHETVWLAPSPQPTSAGLPVGRRAITARSATAATRRP